MTRKPLILALALVAAASPALAEQVVTGKRLTIDEQGRVTRTVTFADLNLASPAGEKTLLRRVGAAVKFVCRQGIDSIDENFCRNYAWDGARPQIDLALGQARGGSLVASATLTTLTISAPGG